MSRLRRLCSDYRRLSVLLIAVVLAVRLLVPAGFMIASDHGRIVVGVCSAAGGKTMTIEIPGMGDEAPDGDDAAEAPCAFPGAPALATGAVDPVLLGAAIAFVMTLALVLAARPAVRAAPFLRPPPQGPPATF